MQIDWDIAIPMDDGVVLRADVFRPVGDGKYPVILSYGPYAKGLAFQEGYKSQWSRVIKAGARSTAGLQQQISELGVGRSGEMGAGRLRLRARRLARRRALAGLSRRLVGARGAGPLRMRRMGRHAELEQRQSRHQRHFLLRHEPVECRRAEAAASRRALHLGRLVGLLPRTLPPRRHPLRLPQQLVSAPGLERAAWRRLPRRQERGDRRVGRRTRHTAGSGTCQDARRHAGRRQAAPLLRRLLRRAHRRLRGHRGAAAVGR